MNRKAKLKLDWCSYQAAKYAVMNWHYSKAMPAGKLIKVGVWENEKYIGCVIFGRGNSNGIGRPYNLKQTECCELVRIALNSHISPVTRICSIAMRMIKNFNSGLKLIISFADPAHGHVGKIYQAGNWIYAGKTAPDYKFKDADGRIWHSRQVSSTGFKKYFGLNRPCANRRDCEKITVPSKHRYLYPLDKETRKRVLSFSKPYPCACEA